jgi:hypothetical protein
MTQSNENTLWAKSYKGNLWRRINGVVLVVGKHKTANTYWARRGESFLPGRFPTESAAKSAAEYGSTPELDINAIWGEE